MEADVAAQVHAKAMARSGREASEMTELRAALERSQAALERSEAEVRRLKGQASSEAPAAHKEVLQLSSLGLRAGAEEAPATTASFNDLYDQLDTE
jgi:hypothetical protein